MSMTLRLGFSRSWRLFSERFKPLDARARNVSVDDGDLWMPRVGE